MSGHVLVKTSLSNKFSRTHMQWAPLLYTHCSPLTRTPSFSSTDETAPYPIVTYLGMDGDVVFTKIQNLSKQDCELRFVYVDPDGNEEAEDLETVKPECSMETVCPRSYDGGDRPDAWLLKNKKNQTVLKVAFQIEVLPS